MKLLFRNLILRFTHRLWNRRISSVLCRMYEDRVSDSRQLHELAARFDPTQEDSKILFMR